MSLFEVVDLGIPSLPKPRSEDENIKSTVLLQTLKPILNVFSFYGFFPFQVDSNNALFREHPHIIIAGVFAVFGICCSVYQIIGAIIGITMRYGTHVVMTQVLWFSSGTVSILVTVFMQFRYSDFAELVGRWSDKERKLKFLISFEKFEICARRSIFVYGVIAFLSVLTLTIHSAVNPRFPAYILHYWPAGDIPTWITLCHTIFFGFYSSWTWAGVVSFEIWICVMSQAFIVPLEAMALECDRFTELNYSSALGQQSSEILDKQNDADNISERNLDANNVINNLASTSADLLKFIQCYQEMDSLQSSANDFIGPVLFIDFLQVVIMICSVLYLCIEYPTSVDTLIVFTCNAVCITCRLVYLILWLGTMSAASENANLSFGKLISSNNFPADISSRVIGHLSAYSTNPISYSAWGFFNVTRDTLLTTSSLIATYLVVLIQS